MQVMQLARQHSKEVWGIQLQFLSGSSNLQSSKAYHNHQAALHKEWATFQVPGSHAHLQNVVSLSHINCTEKQQMWHQTFAKCGGGFSCSA